VIGTYDIEASNWIDFRCAGVFNGKKYVFCRDVKEIVEAFLDLKCDIYYAHYGGKYDIRFILEELLNRFDIKAIVIRDGLGCVKVYKKGKKQKLFEIRDSGLILPLSLKKLTQIFDVEHKKIDVDIEDIDNLSDDVLKKYLMYDCMGLYEVLKKYLSQFEKAALTIASQSLSEFKRTYDIKKLYSPKKLEDFFRDSYYGGRVDVFKRYGTDLKYYDVNSMYPYVMKKFDYPIGAPLKTFEFKKNKLGIYKINWHIDNLDIPLLPYRFKNKLLFANGYGEGVYTSVEIEKALQLGYDVDIEYGYYFRNSDNVFKEFVEKFYYLKSHFKDDRRFIYKLILNSLYGKLGQHREHRKMIFDEPTHDEIVNGHYTLFQTINDKEIWLKMDEDKKPHTTTHIASFVTSYARIYLYEIIEKILEKSGDIYYCDTDSVVTDVELRTSDRLGDLSKECEIQEGIFLLPKVYALKTDKGTFLKAKGFNIDKLSFEDYKKALNGDFSTFKFNKNQLIGIFESRVRNQSLLSLVNRNRSLKSDLEKREVLEDGISTKPLNIQELQQKEFEKEYAYVKKRYKAWYENLDDDLVDYEAYHDSTLTKHENEQILKSLWRNYV